MSNIKNVNVVFNSLTVSEAIDMEDFYNVGHDRYRIALQGDYSPRAISKYQKLGWKFDIKENNNGYISASKFISDISVEITLT